MEIKKYSKKFCKDINNNNKNVLKQENEKHLLDVFRKLKIAREMWNFINEIRNCEKRQTEIPKLKNSFGTVLTNGNDIANLLNYKFSALGEYFGLKEQYRFRNKPARHSNKIIFRCKTTTEIFDILNNLNVKDPLGSSLIPAWALKDSREHIVEPLCFLFNPFLTEQRFPDDLKRAHVLPLFKKDDPEDPINYRPISLTGALAKIFEILLRDQKLAQLEMNKLLVTTQFGYRKKVSTTDAHLYCTEKIRYCLEKKHRQFLDLSKAFDSISHHNLLHKTKLLEFSEQANTILESYLENCVQKVKFAKYESNWIALDRGVPLGTVLGPLLFNIYVNDLKNDTDVNSNIIKYADDTFIFCSGKTISEPKLHLERSIDNLILFFRKIELNVNESKTEFIIFGALKRNKIEEIVVNGCTVLEKKVVKYLGVHIDCDLSFDEEIKNVLSKIAVGIKVIYSIKKIFPEKTRSALLSALVLSHLHYSIVLFSGLKKSLRVTLKKQLNGGLKSCFNRTKFDRTTDLKIKHKILPVEYLIKYRVIIYFIKLLKADLPAFDELNIATLSAKMNDRTNKLSLGGNQKTNIMQNCF